MATAANAATVAVAVFIVIAAVIMLSRNTRNIDTSASNGRCSVCERNIVPSADYYAYGSCGHRAHGYCFAIGVLSSQCTTCPCGKSTATVQQPDSRLPLASGLDRRTEVYLHQLQAEQKKRDGGGGGGGAGSGAHVAALGMMSKWLTAGISHLAAQTRPGGGGDGDSGALNDVSLDDSNVRAVILHGKQSTDALLKRDFSVFIAAQAHLTIDTFLSVDYSLRDLHALGYSEWALLVANGISFARDIAPWYGRRDSLVAIADLVELYHVQWADFMQLPDFAMDLVRDFSLNELGALGFTFGAAVAFANMQTQHVTQFKHIPLRACVQELGLTPELLYGERLAWSIGNTTVWSRADLEAYCPPPPSRLPPPPALTMASGNDGFQHMRQQIMYPPPPATVPVRPHPPSRYGRLF